MDKIYFKQLVLRQIALCYLVKFKHRKGSMNIGKRKFRLGYFTHPHNVQIYKPN